MPSNPKTVKGASQNTEEVATLAEAKPTPTPSIYDLELSGEESTPEIAHSLNNLLGVDRWAFEVQFSNFPPGYAALSGRLHFVREDGLIGKTFSGTGASPISKGKLFSAFREAKRLALLDALEIAGADVSFPEEPEVEEVKRSYGSSAPAASAPKAASQGNSYSRGTRPAPKDEDGDEDTYLCMDCEEEGKDPIIQPHAKRTGEVMSPKAIAEWAQQKAARPLCFDHLKKVLDAQGGGRGGSRGGYSGGRSGGYNRGGYGR